MPVHVRLTPAERALQPEIGDVIGILHGTENGVAEVEWPGRRSWHREGDLERVEQI
jgi:hypothetical protein